MLRQLKNTASLNNLKNAGRGGQVATLLILFLVVMVMFILVTVNIGAVSKRATHLANSTDGAALVLGSPLASYAYNLYKLLGNRTEKCKKGGMLSSFIAFFAALVVTIASYGSMSWVWVVVLAGVAGMVGGALGAAIQGDSGTAIAMGAVRGLAIGVAVGAGGTLPGWGPAVFGTTLMAGVSATALMTAVIVLTAATFAATMYTAYVSMQMSLAIMSVLARYFKRLPRNQNMAEQVFYYAFSNEIDEQATVPDVDDLDGDGSTTNLVPRFAYWWRDHMQNVIANSGGCTAPTQRFIEDALIPFYENAKYRMMPLLNRLENECACTPAFAGGPRGSESPLVELFRTLYTYGYNVDTALPADDGPRPWRPGPDNAQLTNWYCSDDDDDPPYGQGYDGVDGVQNRLDDFMNYARILLGEIEDPACGRMYTYDPASLGNELQPEKDCDDVSNWLTDLYCPREDYDTYRSLVRVGESLEFWRNNTISVRLSMGACQVQAGAWLDTFMRQDGPFCQCYPTAKEAERLAKNETTEDQLCAIRYPCSWSNENFTACGPEQGVCLMRDGCPAGGPCRQGIYYPNAPCRLLNGEKSVLLREIRDIRNYINSLPVNNVIPEFCGGNPCQFNPNATDRINCSLCPPPSPLPLPPPTLWPNPTCGAATNTQFSNVTYCWYGNIHPKGSPLRLGEGQARLRIYYDYRVRCDCFEGTCEYQICRPRMEPCSGCNCFNMTGDCAGCNPVTCQRPVTESCLSCDCARMTGDCARCDPVYCRRPIREPCTSCNCFSMTGDCTWCDSFTCTRPPLDCVECDPTLGNPECRSRNCTACMPSGPPRVRTGRGFIDLLLPFGQDIDLSSNTTGTCAQPGRCYTRSAFMTKLNEFQTFVNSINTTALGAPCDTSRIFATIDEDHADEFKPVLASLCNMANYTNEFLPQVQSFGENPCLPSTITWPQTLSYDWTDSRGPHKITVTVSNFTWPRIKKKTSGSFLMKKVCLVLKIPSERPWVQVIREDPNTKPVVSQNISGGAVDYGLQWNPFYTGTLRRNATVIYNYNRVDVTPS